MKYKDEIKVLDDFKRAKEKKRDWIDEAKEDFEFALGQQWKAQDKEELRKAGVPALTINKIQPNLHLISGIQRQNRTDLLAYPEGQEDSLSSEIVTRLIKNSMKTSNGEHKISEQFEDGNTCGEGWIEPYVDYTYDLVSGQFKLKKLVPFNIFVDPDSSEYDLSDAEYVIKFTPSLSEDKIIQLFPDKEAEIKKIEKGVIDFDLIGKTTELIQALDYPHFDSDEVKSDPTDPYLNVEKRYDLTEYYYKKYVTKYLVVNRELGETKELDDKEEAEQYAQYVNSQNTERVPTVVVIKRKVPEIWVMSMVGMKVIDDSLSPYYPKWKSYPFIPYFAHRTTVPIDEAHLMTQGIARSLKDVQQELNKRRSQELRHLNSSANSGWLSVKGAFVDKEKVRKFGATSGVVIEYKEGKDKPEKITPTPLSQGHYQLAQENAQDMKEISGINADLLAMNDNSTQSGKAIMLRQKQGIVMIQRIMDNFSQSKRLLGRFLLSQLGELYTVESAMRVCGDAFIKEKLK